MLSELRRHLETGNFDQVETTWMEIVDQGPDVQAVGSLLEEASTLLRLGERGRTGTLLELLLPTIAGLSEQLSGDTILRLQELLVRAHPTNRDLFSSYVEAYMEHHGPTSVERAYFNACRVPDSANPGAALERLDRLRRFRVGAVVYHESGWGMGEILAIDPILGQVHVDLESKKDHRIAIEAVDSILQVIEEHCFRALVYRGGDELRRLADEDPVALVNKILDEFGSPLPQRDIKARLVPEVVDAKSWSKWWNQAKTLLRDSGFFRVGDRSPYRVERLSEALSFEDDLLQRFESADWKERRLAALQVLRGGQKKFPQAYPRVVEKLTAELEVAKNAERAVDLASLLRRQEDREAGRTAASSALGRFSVAETAAAMEALPSTEDLAALVKQFAEERPEEWPETARLSFLGRSDSLRAAVCAVLEERDPAAVAAITGELFAAPRLSPEGFVWLLDRRLRDVGGAALEPIRKRNARGLLVLMIDLLEHLVDREVREGRVAVKDLFRKVELLMMHDKGGFFLEAVRAMRTKERLALHRRLVRAQDHLPQAAPRLLEVLGTVEPVINEEDEVLPWEDDDIIFTTAAGLERRREEYREITEVKIPEIIRAIGVAREFGDLSENAEYTSALEERDNLTKRAKVIEEDLNKALLIPPSEGDPKTVGLGSQIRVRNVETGEERAYRVLGPWDGSPDEGVLNYRSPLGRVFLGKREGEELECELPGGTKRFKILECGADIAK